MNFSSQFRSFIYSLPTEQDCVLPLKHLEYKLPNHAYLNVLIDSNKNSAVFWIFIGVNNYSATVGLNCHYDQVFTSWFFRWITKNSIKEWKRSLALEISALVPEVFKFEKCVKCANEMTDDVIYSTQFYILYINRALKLGRLIVLQNTHLWLWNIFFPMATHSFPVPTHLISICKWFWARQPLNKATNPS